MTIFSADAMDRIARVKEVVLTTYGRTTGKPTRVTIWVATDGQRVFIRSGQGFKRHWPKNLQKQPEGALRVGGLEVPFTSRIVSDPDEARRVSGLYRPKYGVAVTPSKPGQPLTPGEQATFELLPR
jgi:deazaflavin-dependent oxidoreductase (nitroreductase family)